MDNSQILEKLNEIIKDEKGCAVTMEDTLLDAQLDSLGIMIALITIDSEFEIFDQAEAENALETLDVKNLTIKDLVEKCRLSITNTSTPQSAETDT